MIDLHTHSIFSDGELVPSELARRAVAKGYRAIAITDHADHSNLDFIIPRIVTVCEKISESCPLQAIPGIELTHVHPDHISSLAHEARTLGAKIIIVHGETIVEPVMPGTNRAALEAPIDILAHPGLLTEEEAKLAAGSSIFLEI
ncbi:MAG: histidinol phosphate phosphatase domain-containing protein, partial [Deltaproteobacteria bacterium]|nr:histidinol phosphate phosphatase domain-containing protein [Deltaproteobacteria bacterium]